MGGKPKWFPIHAPSSNWAWDRTIPPSCSTLRPRLLLPALPAPRLPAALKEQPPSSRNPALATGLCFSVPHQVSSVVRLCFSDHARSPDSPYLLCVPSCPLWLAGEVLAFPISANDARCRRSRRYSALRAPPLPLPRSSQIG